MDLEVERPASPWTRVRNLPLPEPTLAALAAGLLWDRRVSARLPGSRLAGVAGAVLVVLGTALVGGAWWSASTVLLARPERVVVTGPYARMRNPMYVGWGLVHLGLALSLRSPGLLAGLLPAGVLLHREVVREERVLRARLGSPYDAYRDAVPRYGWGRRGEGRRPPHAVR